MNDDYLWDRTGEPDPEIQELEEVLGTLRYQTRPLALPAGVRPERRRRYYAPLAIAATIALMILAAGLWLRVQRSQSPRAGETARGPQPESGSVQQPIIAAKPASDKTESSAGIREKGTPKERINVRPRKPLLTGNSLAKNRNKQRRSVDRQDDVSTAQFEEARAAKEQLMLALRLASAKLNFAQRKTQGPPTPGSIRNQHKVG